MNRLFAVFALFLVLVACSSPPAVEQPVVSPPSQPSAPVSAQIPVQIPPVDSGSVAQDASQRSASTVNVEMQGMSFSPANIQVKVGDTVVWTNRASAPHNVKSSDGVLNSPDMVKGESWSFTFTDPGTHNYICDIHPSMHGQVVVESITPH